MPPRNSAKRRTAALDRLTSRHPVSLARLSSVAVSPSARLACDGAGAVNPQWRRFRSTSGN
jgi:hypothetical protein